jgi:hypothetical protein
MMKPTRSTTLIVRLWLEPSAEDGIWRACVTNARSGEKQYFQDPQELAWFIAKNMFDSKSGSLGHSTPFS